MMVGAVYTFYGNQHFYNYWELPCQFEHTKFSVHRPLRLNVSPIPVLIVESRGAAGLDFVVCVYTYSHQCYASGQLVDRARLQFKPDCDMRLNSWMSKVIVNSKKKVRSSEMERKIYKEQNFRLWSASRFGTGWSEENKIFCRQFHVCFQVGWVCVCVCRDLQQTS